MPMHRLGRVVNDPVDTSKRPMKKLPWAEKAAEALTKYLDQQPTDEELARAEAYEIGPVEFLENPHLRVRTLEAEMGHMFHNFIRTLEEQLDSETAQKIAYAAGLSHGKRRLGSFIKRHGLPSGTQTMAMWQDTAHAAAGVRHTTALFAHYDDELVEVVRTEDSFSAHTGNEPAAQIAFFNGFMDGYAASDPGFSYAEEFTRERADGRIEYVHRFWYPKKG